MMKKETRLEKTIPSRMSVAMSRRRALSTTTRRSDTSSTSIEVCQKKRYGEMVVPRRATTMAA